MTIKRTYSTSDDEAVFLKIRRVLRGMAIATAVSVLLVLSIDNFDRSAKLPRDFVGMVLGLILGFGTWFLVNSIAYIPRVTPSVRLGSALIAAGLMMNFVEELPWIATHPFFGNAGTLHALKVDSAIIILGVLILLCASYFIILEVSRSRFELAIKSDSLNTSLADQKKLYRVLQFISEQIHSGTQEGFFRSLVENLSNALNTHTAIVAECTGSDGAEIRTLAVWTDGQLADNFVYERAGTPCAEVYEGRTCIHPRGFRDLLPPGSMLATLDAESYVGVPLRNAMGAVVGHLVILDNKALPADFSQQTILDTFAVRAGAELERLHNETALRKSETRFRLVTENASDVIWATDAELNVSYISPSVQEYIGYTPEDAKSIWQEFVSDELRGDVLHELVTNTFDGGERQAKGAHPSRTIIREDIRKDGAIVTGEYHISLVPSENGRDYSVIGITRDITARRNTELAIQMDARMDATSTLAGGIAHEFNNLMAVVLGNASLATMDVREDHPTIRRLKIIEEAAVRADELATQLLAYARGGKYAPKCIALNSLVEAVLAAQKADFPAGIQTECHFDQAVQNIYADQSQIEQTIASLLTNAVEAMGESGHLIISTTAVDVSEEEKNTTALPGIEPGAYVLLQVQDSGCGMDQETQAKVFDPFFTSKQAGYGRGLGLAAAYGVVRSHKGGIAVESKPGAGTTFRVYLPVTTRSPVAPSKLPKASLAGTETVLIIDDEERIREVLEQVLELKGYTVLTARNGEEGVAVARSHAGEIHIIILDMRMPVLDGPGAFPLLRQLRPDTKIILCSGYTVDKESQAMLDAGAAAYVKKPFRLDGLLNEIRMALDRASAPGNSG